MLLALAGLGAAAPAGLPTTTFKPLVHTLGNLLSSLAEATPTASPRPSFPCNPLDALCPLTQERRPETTPTAPMHSFFSCKPEAILCPLTHKRPLEAEVSVASVSTSTQTTTSAAPSAADIETRAIDGELDDFENNPAYSRMAEQQRDIPYPYELVIDNYNKTAIHQAIETYSSEVSDPEYAAYDANECAQHCNKHHACDAFAIYVESGVSCTDCANPEPIDVAKCDLYNTALQQPDIRKEAEQENIPGQTYTQAVRAYNGYNKIQEITTMTATRTVVSYLTVTTTSPVTITMHHTMFGNSTVTQTVPAYFTVTEAVTITATPEPESDSSDSEIEVLKHWE